MIKSPPRSGFNGRGGFDSGRRTQAERAAFSTSSALGEMMSMETVQPENAPPVQMRSSTPLSTLMLRFVGLLFVAVALLALVYSR
jgi:hypothetical protein